MKMVNMFTYLYIRDRKYAYQYLWAECLTTEKVYTILT